MNFDVHWLFLLGESMSHELTQDDVGRAMNQAWEAFVSERRKATPLVAESIENEELSRTIYDSGFLAGVKMMRDQLSTLVNDITTDVRSA